MDVKTAFLNGDIDETIYMVQQENFVYGDTKRMVCKLLVNGITSFIKLSFRLVLR